MCKWRWLSFLVLLCHKTAGKRSNKPNKRIQNAAAHLKRTLKTPLLVNLHWFPITARIKCKSLTLAYRTGSAPAYLNAMVQLYSPSRPFRSSDECLLSLPSLCSKRSQSRLFSFIESWWCTDLPSVDCSSDSFGIFKKCLNTLHFNYHLSN